MRKFLTSAAVGVAVLGGATAVATTSVLPAFAQSKVAGQAQSADQGDTNHQGRHGMRRHLVREAIKTAADTIGVSPQDLVNELKSGKSIAEVATEHGKDPQAVVDALVAKINAAVDKALQAGKISEDTANKIKTKAPEIANRIVNAHRQPGQGGPDGGRRGHRPDASGGAAATPGQGGSPAPDAPVGSLN
jgi:hypothetical protein